MKPLNIEKALQLEQIMRPYLEDVTTDDTVLSMMKKVVKSMASRPSDFLKALMLMTGMTSEEIEEKTKDDKEAALELFTDGLKINKVWMLRDFVRKISDGHTA